MKKITYGEQMDLFARKPDTVFVDEFSEEIWKTTYKHHSDNSVDDTMRRVADAIASVEDEELRQKWSDEFYAMLSGFSVVPGGRIISNAGTGWKGTTLINCFVGPRPSKDIDSLKGILKNLENQAQTLKSEGGWGENFSYIRPRGAFIYGIGVETPGAVKYMELFDKSSEIVTAGAGEQSKNEKAKGKIRKGAQMGVLDVWHPDVIEFITAKQKPGALTKFNVSVSCSDDFMEKVADVMLIQKEIADLSGSHEKGKRKERRAAIKLLEKKIDAIEWDLVFPDTQHPSYKPEWRGDIRSWKASGYPVKVYRTVKVAWLWNLIMESTYNRAEPGVLFLDRANYYNPLWYAETIMATNPCGEQTLAPGNICCLSSINLTQFVKPDESGFDMDRIRKTVRTLVRFLDNVNSYSDAPLPEYIESMRKKRRIGIGVMGWGSALYMLKLRFASQKADAVRDELMSTIAREAYMASIDLAEEKGMFELCNPVKHSEGAFVKKLGLPKEYMEKLRRVGIRNSSLLSIQPTGTTGIFANVVSGGLEPVFMPEYIRTVVVGTMPEHIASVTPRWFKGEWFETEMFKLDKEGDEEILKGVDGDGVVWKIDRNRGLTKEVPCIDFGVRYRKERGDWDSSAPWAVTALSLTAEEHLSDLKGFTRWVDSAVSKTINMPNDYSFDKFKNVYLDAWKTGYIKGVTTYRSGTMASVLSAAEERKADQSDEEIILEDIKLSDDSPSRTKVLKAEGKKWWLHVVFNDDGTRPFAIFVHTNNVEPNALTSNTVDLLLDLARRKGIPEKFIEEVTHKISMNPNPTKVGRVLSLLLRHGVLIRNIVAVLDKVEEAFVGTFVFQIKKYLASFIKDGEKVEGEVCGECGSDKVVFSEGCKRCSNCGSSKCG